MINPRYKIIGKGRFLGISGEGISMSYKRFLNKFKLDKNLQGEVNLAVKDVYGNSVLGIET